MQTETNINVKVGEQNEQLNYLDKCHELAHKPSILDELEREVQKRGFAGPADIPKLVFLVLHTGVLKKPVSLVVKGPSVLISRQN